MIGKSWLFRVLMCPLVDPEYIHLLRAVSLAYLLLGASSPTDHPLIPQLRSQPLTHTTTHEQPIQERPRASTEDAVPVVLAPVAPVEGYHTNHITSNASTASSSDPSHTGTVQSISTNSAGSTGTDRTESSSSFIHVSHPDEDDASRGAGREGATAGLGGLDVGPSQGLAVAMASEKPIQTEDSASASTVTPQPRPTQPTHPTHPTPAPPTAAFLSPSYLDGDDAETGIPSRDSAYWWIGARGVTGEPRRDVEQGLAKVVGMRGRGSIAETRVSFLFFLLFVRGGADVQGRRCNSSRRTTIMPLDSMCRRSRCSRVSTGHRRWIPGGPWGSGTSNWTSCAGKFCTVSPLALWESVVLADLRG